MNLYAIVNEFYGLHILELFIFILDDGTTPDRIAQITGPPDRCQHAAEIITDLLRSVQVG